MRSRNLLNLGQTFIDPPVSKLSHRLKDESKIQWRSFKFLRLIGGGAQGTLRGQLEYLVQSNKNVDSVPPEDRYKYIDDLTVGMSVRTPERL